MDNNMINVPNISAKITWLNENPSSAKRASASIIIADSFQIHGLSIIEGPKGLFVSMPQRQITDDNGKRVFIDLAHPINADTRAAIQSAVLGAFTVKTALNNPNQKRFRKHNKSEVHISEQTDIKDDVKTDTSVELDDAEAETEDESDEALSPIMGQMA